MSGHSKWAQIKRQKGVADAKKGTLFTKLANTITIAAREGGGNPEINFKLRLALEKARQANMPKENMERAIKRGTGELGGVQIEEITYEAFGPEGITLLIETVTDNKNRTASEIRKIVTKHGGRLGEANSVNWMFERKGVIYFKKPSLAEEKEALELELIDQGAEDFKEEGEVFIVYSLPADLEKIKIIIEGKNIPVEHATAEFIAKNPLDHSQIKNPEKIQKFLEELENSEEVNNFYSNYEE